MKNEELKTIKSNSILSAVSLVFQSSYAALLGFAAFFILTLKSSVYLLGIYNTVLASISFLNYFTNLGLAAALIQKKEVKSIDLNSAFFVQFFLVTLSVIAGFFFTDKIFSGYKNLPPHTIYLYWAVLISFFISSLKTIPSVLLEKNVQIYKIVLVQSVENSVFYILVIVLTVLNFNINALIVAVLARAVIGCIAIYILKPWFPRAKMSFSIIRDLLRYGIPFQGNSFLALVKDDLMIIYLGRVLGFEKLGIISFGKKYAEMSLRLITDNINRVSFPLFARFQQNEELLKKSLMKVLLYSAILVFPIITGALFVFDSILNIIPGYFAKWQHALPSFYFFSLSALFVSLTTPFINLFNAVGKVKKSLLFMVVWTAIMWIFVPPSIALFDYNGVAPVFFVSSLTVFFVIFEAKKLVQFSILQSLKGILIAVFVMAMYLTFVRFVSVHYVQKPIIYVVLSLMGAPALYFFILTRFEKLKVREIVNNLFRRNEIT